MSHELHAAPTEGRLDLSGGRQIAVAVRHTASVASLVIALLFGVTSVAHAASNFYWYGHNGSTCWQTGQPGASSEACSSVGAGYLATPGGYSGGLAHMLEDTVGGIGQDFNLSPSGDYCSYYRVGGPVLTSQDSTNEGTVSGLSMPTPYSSYQEGDKTANAYNACQANGTYWGQVLHGPSGKGCATGATCGIHHYVSFKSQEGKDHPWSSAFGEPSLAVSADAGISTVAPSASYGGWGYVCPELEDTSSHGVLEYCFEEWRSAHDAPEWKNERKGECNNPFAQVITYFWPGTSYATKMSGSINTFEVGSTGSGHFEAKITPTNLQNAIKLINAQCSGWHLSEKVGEYALIGVEQGMEGWSGVTTLGGWGANLQLRTEYTSAPRVTTGAASEVGEEQATFNGSVNPEGSDTHYYFEYGSTTAYGSPAPAPPGNDAGSGTSSAPVSVTTTQLEQNITYHYRLVASNSYGTSYGGDQTLTTTGHQGLQLAVQGPSHSLDFYAAYDGEPFGEQTTGGAGSTYGASSLVRFNNVNGTGVQLVVEGANHTLDFYSAYDNKPFSEATIGGENSTYGTPSMVRYSNQNGTGVQLVVQGANHTLDFYGAYDNKPFSEATIGGENSTYGTPSMVRFSNANGTGLQLVVQGANHTLDFYSAYDNQAFTEQTIGGVGSTYGAPSLVRFRSANGTGVQLVVEGANHTLDFYSAYDNKPFTEATIGGENSTYGTPSLVRFSNANGTGLQLVVQGANHTLDFYSAYDNKAFTEATIGGENSTYSSPSLVRIHAPRGAFEL